MADYQKISVSTQGLTFFNEDRIILKLTYLDDAMTVTMMFPQIVDGKATYPKELRQQVLISAQNISALQQLVIDAILPAYEKGSTKDVGVFTTRAKDQMFEVFTQGGTMFVMIHDKIENRVPQNTYMFKFDKTMIVTDYDIAAVSCNTSEIDAQFTLFVKALESFVDLCSGVTAHQYQHKQSWHLENIKKHLNALNNKLGLGIEYPNKNTNYNSGFESGNSYNTTQGNSDVTNVTHGTMNDLFPGMGDELPFK